ncbi:MAG: DNA alkylation repair protein [Bacteroidetes bacterium]|nr:MAG: DNA alkylation repair protein [Bacteroidota bacterium]
MTKNEVLKELKSYGNEGTKKTFLNHGAKEPFYGVQVQDLKKIQKKVKKDYNLAIELYDTGNSDAMYLAGLIADEKQMTKSDLNKWVKGAYWYMISEFTVPWVAADSKHGYELGLMWIESKDEKVAASGWATLASWASIRPDEEIDKKVFSKLLDRIEKTIHKAQNRERYAMNNFVIAIGGYITDLTDKAIKIAGKVGKVEVPMGNTSCKVPFAKEYIEKMIKMGRIGKKRKMARC